MTTLEIAWGMSLLAVLWTVPVAAMRLLAYQSGEIDHTRTMRITATVAVALAVACVLCLTVLSGLLLSR